MNAASLIEKLSLRPHPEGGHYRETYRAPLTLNGLPAPFPAPRAASTGIYFLLEGEQFSGFHRILSDEMWHFYAGAPLVVEIIDPHGGYSSLLLGPDVAAGQQFQAVVNAHSWFASHLLRPQDGFSLVGCTVSPGFDFADFEMARRSDLAATFPQHRELIARFTRD